MVEMTEEKIQEKYNKTLDEIADIELIADKSKRLKWREKATEN